MTQKYNLDQATKTGQNSRLITQQTRHKNPLYELYLSFRLIISLIKKLHNQNHVSGLRVHYYTNFFTY
jgi:hypothetical protein